MNNGEEAKNGENGEEERVRLDGGGYYDTEIYESSKNKYSHYNQSIAVDDNEVSSYAIFSLTLFSFCYS